MQTKFLKISVIGIAFAILAVAYLTLYPAIKENRRADEADEFKTFPAKTTERKGITITAKPKVSENKIMGFEIYIDAHSGVLDQDFVLSSLLIDDQGREHKPSAWQGDGPGGHHRQGILLFNDAADASKEIKLKLYDKSGESAWSFSWP